MVITKVCVCGGGPEKGPRALVTCATLQQQEPPCPASTASLRCFSYINHTACWNKLQRTHAVLSAACLMHRTITTLLLFALMLLIAATQTLPSEAAKVLDKGVRKMTPRIMTWYQYGEAALHYMQQVRTAWHHCRAVGPSRLERRNLHTCLPRHMQPAARNSHAGVCISSSSLTDRLTVCLCGCCRVLPTSRVPRARARTSPTTPSAASTSCCTPGAMPSCAAYRRDSGGWLAGWLSGWLGGPGYCLWAVLVFAAKSVTVQQCRHHTTDHRCDAVLAPSLPCPLHPHAPPCVCLKCAPSLHVCPLHHPGCLPRP